MEADLCTFQGSVVGRLLTMTSVPDVVNEIVEFFGHATLVSEQLFMIESENRLYKTWVNEMNLAPFQDLVSTLHLLLKNEPDNFKSLRGQRNHWPLVLFDVHGKAPQHQKHVTLGSLERQLRFRIRNPRQITFTKRNAYAITVSFQT